MRWSLWLSVLVVAAGCGDRDLNLADDPDVAEMRASFQCAGGANSDACRVIDDFVTAGEVRSYPTADPRDYLGESLCAGEFPTRTLKVLTLTTKVSSPASVSDRPGATGVLAVSQSSIANQGESDAVVDRVLASLRAGDPSPGLEQLDPSIQDWAREVLPATWALWRARRGSGVRESVPSSDKSLLVNPGHLSVWWDDAPTLRALGYVRETSDGRLIMLEPSEGAVANGVSACVIEARPIPE